jgi:hydrogenase maturation protease
VKSEARTPKFETTSKQKNDVQNGFWILVIRIFGFVRISIFEFRIFSRSNPMPQTLVIGFGNLDRGDDGVAFDVVNRLRRQLGLRPLEADETGLDDRSGDTGAVFVRQLVPELALDVGGCKRLVFVDAHVAAEPRAIVCVAVRPEARLSSPLSHTLPVEGFLWLVQAAAGRAPESFLVSLRGHCFEPGRGLSPAAAALVEQAAATVWRLTGTKLAPPLSIAKR